MIFQNYHKHTHDSNISTPDSSVTIEDYAKRCVELGHSILSSCEHGWQGRYYEVYDIAKKYGLKFIFGTEAYWVKDRFEKDKTNGHITIFAKSEKGRREINRILSDANIEGYYFKPRVDVDLLLSLTPSEVFLTSACIAFWKYDDIEETIIKLKNHFKNNFMLEVQYHHTEEQRKINKRILELSKTHGIDIIMGCDSHYIYPEQKKDRDDVLEAKGITYEEEHGWFMDYPDGETAIQRFKEQSILNEEQIKRAISNTNIFLKFDDIEFSEDIKLPSLYKNMTQEEKDKTYTRLLTQLWKDFSKNIPTEQHKYYIEEIQKEINTVKNTKMTDYFLLDYKIVKRAIEKGGIITNTGRGSGVSYLTNTLLGFSKIDRLSSPIHLYPERFMSESRILETKSLPDLDLNCGNPEVFAQAQSEILGEDHAYPMIAFGTFKDKSAFKLYAKSQNLDFNIANNISKQIEKYEKDLQYAEEDEKDLINIYDYVDEEYHELIKESEKYKGIISDKKAHPCGYLIYEGNIKEEIGLIKCKSESTKKEVITTVIDGSVAEKYKFLKNDLLKVDVVLLIDKIYKRAGIEPHTVSELLDVIKNNERVWDIYAKGLTLGVNQVEKSSTTQKVMKYKPKNISELIAFIAAIRPSFKSIYSIFESRQEFKYGIPTFDRLIQTEEMPNSFILYQEQVMATLQYAGFPSDETYGIIKAISKKKPAVVSPLKNKFINGFKTKIIEDDGVHEDEAIKMCEKVWQIIEDSSGYGFNASHAYSYALDSVYCAYLKSHYPFEFYEVMLQTYSDKGNKDKVAKLKQEMKIGFNITEGDLKYGLDNTGFILDKENHKINPSLSSIKHLSIKAAKSIFELSQNKKHENFIDLLMDAKKVLNSRQLDIMIKINYFSKFGSIHKIEEFMTYYDLLHDRKQFSKEEVEKLKEFKEIIKNNSISTEKLYKDIDTKTVLTMIWDNIPNTLTPLNTQIEYELDHIGYIKTVVPKIPLDYAIVTDIETKYKNPVISLYRINNGETETIKVKLKDYENNPFKKFDMIKTIEVKLENKWKKSEDGKWIKDEFNKEAILKKWSFVKF